ncbi:MAG TPA: hypothetical protein VGM64_06595 [Lacunisphaera sp.]|jgi:hypothetical protein
MLISRVVPCVTGLLLSFSFASAGTIFNAQGLVDRTNYTLEALTWSTASISDKLGPTFSALNPGAVDDRPTLYKPTSTAYAKGIARINPWELGTAPASDGDYWSDSGQVGYVPDNAADAGLDRIALFAYYSKVFAISPRLDWASGTPHSDPQTRDPYYIQMNGASPTQPVAMCRGYGMTQNEAIVLFRDGLMAVAGTQTSRSGSDRPYPGLMFPENKIPTSIAITSENEFALVTVWDTDTLKGQLAVIALEGKYLTSHTMPYMGLPNEGSWSDFKLLGYIDLPMSAPSSVSAASNGYWNGPSQTNGKDLGAFKLSTSADRSYLYTNSMIALNGYAIVASKQENKVATVDLTPLFTYMRTSWLSSDSSYAATSSARGASPSQFPQTFDINPSNKPTVIWEAPYAKPTAVLAGLYVNRWSTDRVKAYVATEDGTIHILDTSTLLWRSSWQKKGTLGEIGSFQVGKNPVSMCFSRRDVKNLPLIPSTSNSGIPDCFNSVFWVACRGDRSVMACHTYNGQGMVHMTIRDSRMGDPVAISTAVRGPILTVADFSGKKILSFRIGDLVDARNNVTYKCGASGTDKFEFAGELALPGTPFLVGSANVN